MMRLFIIGFVCFLMAACDGEPIFDSSSEAAIKVSSNEIVDSLSTEQVSDFQKAIAYFTIGGKKGKQKMMSQVLSGKFDPETILLENTKVLHGMTGQQIIDKYHAEFLVEMTAEQNLKNIKALKREAEALISDNKFKEALVKYEEISKLPDGDEVGIAGIETTKQALQDFTEKMGYIDNVAITEFVAKRIDTYKAKGVPAVRISLKNNGNRSLDKVAVVVYFKNKDGDVIFDKKFNPVLVSKYNFMGENEPLKPGYIREMKADNYYTIDSTLSEWDEGSAYAKIENIEFSK